jgi:hypothetical protein
MMSRPPACASIRPREAKGSRTETPRHTMRELSGLFRMRARAELKCFFFFFLYFSPLGLLFPCMAETAEKGRKVLASCCIQ